MKNTKKEPRSINIDKDLLDWVEKQVKNKEFDNNSAGIRKCIQITRRLYENADPEDMMKYIHGINTRKN